MEKDVHYRVAKLTCILLDEEKNRQMPVEMQFLTKEDRKTPEQVQRRILFIKHKVKEFFTLQMTVSELQKY